MGILVTYESLRQQILAMADALASAGIRLGDRVVIALPNGLPATVSFFAATIAILGKWEWRSLSPSIKEWPASKKSALTKPPCCRTSRLGGP